MDKIAKCFKKRVILFVLFYIISCGINIYASRYYRLLEKERPLYLGLKGIDSLTANEYLNLSSPTERKYYYDQYWQGRDDERQEFEKRSEYAFKEFGEYAPLSDERIPIYVKYGNPTRRYVITPEKKVGIVSKEYVRPAEIWTYKSEGIEFDFIRLARAYKIIARSQFGETVIIPYLREDTLSQIISDTIPSGKLNKLNFNMSFGRFRQKKDLVRLEIYVQLFIDDTLDCRLFRRALIYNQFDSIVIEKNSILIPVNGNKEYFYDELNLWLPPQKYKVLIEYTNLKTRESGEKEFFADLLDYKEDAKKISDLVFGRLIDESMCEEKFYKPVGRVIPLVKSALPTSTPFYVYHEVYNLKMQEGQYLLKTDYEIYNKEKMRKEIIDIMTQTESGGGNVAHIAAKYHPMDLPPGQYIIVVRTKDMLSGEEYTAVGEFKLEEK